MADRNEPNFAAVPSFVEKQLRKMKGIPPVKKVFVKGPRDAMYYVSPEGKQIYATINHIKLLVRPNGQQLEWTDPVPDEWLIPYISRFVHKGKLTQNDVAPHLWDMYVNWRPTLY